MSFFLSNKIFNSVSKVPLKLLLQEYETQFMFQAKIVIQAWNKLGLRMRGCFTKWRPFCVSVVLFMINCIIP